MRGLCWLFLFVIVVVPGCSRQSAPVDAQRDAIRIAIDLTRQLEPGKVKQSEVIAIAEALPKSAELSDEGLRQSSRWVNKAVAAAIAGQPKLCREYLSHAEHRLTLYEFAVRPPAPR